MKSFLKATWGFILFIAAFVVFVVFSIRSMISDNRARNLEKSYCGSVIDKGYDSPSSGHKSHTEAQYWIIFMDEDIHRAIRVHATPSCWYSTDTGKHVCFTLSGGDMKRYGNTNDYGHLK